MHHSRILILYILMFLYRFFCLFDWCCRKWLDFFHFLLFLLNWFLLSLLYGDICLGYFLPVDDGLQILEFGSDCGLPQRSYPYVSSSIIMDRFVSDCIDAKQVGELQQALAAIGVVGGRGALGDGWRPCQQVASLGKDIYCL